MTVRNLLVAAVLAVLLPSSALAGAWSKGCQFTGGTITGMVGTPTNANKVIDNTDVGCYRFVVADSTHNSGFVHITAISAVITFDPRLDAEIAVAGAPLVVPRFCPAGDTVLTASANPEFSCISIGGANGNAALSGVEGTAASQNASIRVGPGVYYFQVTGACETGDTCQIAVKGEGGY